MVLWIVIAVVVVVNCIVGGWFVYRGHCRDHEIRQRILTLLTVEDGCNWPVIREALGDVEADDLMAILLEMEDEGLIWSSVLMVEGERVKLWRVR